MKYLLSIFNSSIARIRAAVFSSAYFERSSSKTNFQSAQILLPVLTLYASLYLRSCIFIDLFIVILPT